jgi:hypothetical protein
MEKLAINAAALYFALGIAIAQPVRAPGNQSLSLDQQNQLSELIADQTSQPLTNVNFSVAPGVVVPTNVALRQLPVEAEVITPTLQGYSYLAVEELVAIVDTNSRKIISVMQRMRRQENTKAGR